MSGESQVTTVAGASSGKDAAREQSTQPLTPAPRAVMAPRPTGSVTISHKIGWSSTDYHEKADVMVEICLPCGVDDIDETVGRIRRLLDEKLPEELDRVVDKYFDGGPIVFGAGRKVTP